MSKLEIGVMGAANIARKVVIPSLLQAENVELTALASTSGKGKEFLETTNLTQHGGTLAQSVALYDSYQSLLDDSNIDAVYIGLPNHLHMEWSMKAMDAGKHVLCEKPAALNAEQTNKITAHSQAREIIWMEAFMYRFHPQYDIVRHWIENGEIGDIQTIRSMFFQVNDPENIRLIPSAGGGSLYDVGSYCVNVNQMFFKRKPVSVSAQMLTADDGVDSEFMGILDFGKGQTALFQSSFNRTNQNEVQIFGSKGHIHIPQSFVPGNRDLAVHLHRKNEVKTVTVPAHDQYKSEIEYFAKCIFENRQPEVISHDDTVANMETIDALYTAAKEQTAAVDLD